MSLCYQIWFVLFPATTTESPGDGIRGPIFLSEPPSNVIIPNNQGAIIPCAVYGNPTPLVTWVTADGDKVGVLVCRCMSQTKQLNFFFEF